MIDALFRAIPDFHGKRRLLRWFCGRKIANDLDVLVHGCSQISYVLPNQKESIALIFSAMEFTSGRLISS